MKKILLYLSVAFMYVTGSTVNAQEQEFDENLDQLIEWMTGEFDSKAQADKDTAFHNITLKMTRVWKDKPNGAWIYVEQALASKPDKPYRQRMYFVSQITDDEYSSDVYELPEPEKYVGAWKDPSILGDLTPFDLKNKAGCAVIIFYDGFQYGGQTRTGSCKSTMDGAAYATSEVTILNGEVKSWDRGFDADGNQVWGSETGPYIFNK
ncbi:MAG: chromophore lyase CpcT/CpeT [Cryomorphaceae bacterium]